MATLRMFSPCGPAAEKILKNVCATRAAIRNNDLSPVGRLSPEAAAARHPPSLAELVDARHDDRPVTHGRFVRIGKVRLHQRPDQE